MQTILGANGIIAKEMLKHLPLYDKAVRLVSRSGKANTPYEHIAADLLNASAIEDAIAGSDVTYLVAGIAYKASVWQAQWPVIMQNVINACTKHESRLVFFDNVYAYGKVEGTMTEQTPYQPCSQKGAVRKEIAEMLMDAVEKGKLNAMIVRAADFYGPGNTNSMFNMMVTDKHAAGKKAQWMLNADLPHTLTYTPDAGKATAMLGNDTTAYNQVWHLPAPDESLSARQLAAISTEYFDAKAGVQVLPKWSLHLIGWFIQPVAESIEMLYQYDYPYVFDSSKFAKAYGIAASSYHKGIQAIYQYETERKEA